VFRIEPGILALDFGLAKILEPARQGKLKLSCNSV
jgi:hypothetical protein